MSEILDDLQAMRRLDPEGSLDRIVELPQQCRDAWARVSRFSLPEGYRRVTGVVFAGMGGSAIGADLVRSLALEEASVPVLVHRDYGLPAFAGPETVVVACSYSGGTEETLSAYAEGRRRGCRLLAVTTGGELTTRCQADGVPLLDFHYVSQPRSAIGYSVVLLLGVMAQVGQMSVVPADIEAAARAVEEQLAEIGPQVPAASNPAKQLSLALRGRLPVVYGADVLAEVARRWKGEFNEFSKAWSFFEVLPELNHNAVVGYEFPPAFAKEFVVILLTSSFNHPRNRLRVTITEEVLAQRGIEHRVVAARGPNRLAQVLTAVSYGDLVSCYLAMLHGVDPTPVPVIGYLKQRLGG